jgi:beta-N-acetylhexosaminidase
LLAGGVLPVAKHLPGHGRAQVDSHNALPMVDAALSALQAVDFAPFRALNDLPIGMTAHIDYTAIDAGVPATWSPRVIGEIVRAYIGFDGFLLSDDLSMRALGGPLGQRAARALAAGCDAVLHCNGDMAEMQAVAGAIGPLSDVAAMRWRQIVRPHAQEFDPGAGMARLAELLATAA